MPINLEIGLSIGSATWGPTFLAPGLTILGPTQIDKGANGVGIDGNGWIARLVIANTSVGSTFDPSKITLTVSDPGYDATGAATTVTRTIKGGAVVRRQYPNQTSNNNANSGPNLAVYFSLEDDIYAGTTITGAVAAANYYGTVSGYTITGLTNSSTRAYPKPLFGWLNKQHERATGSSFSVEAVAYHRHARNGQQVACVQFIAQDAHSNTAATQTASTPALSTMQTQGNIVEAYKASIPLTSLTQADICQVNAKVYPWIGDSTAVLDLATDGIAWPTSQTQTKLRFLNDKSGTYGGAIVYVKAGAGAGTVGSSATPYATVSAAMTALAAYNNTNKGHNDHSGSIIYLMDDGASGAVAHAISTGISTAAGSCWTEIKADPAAVGAVSIAKSGITGISSLVCFQVPITQASGASFDGGSDNGNSMIAFEGKTITVAGSVPLNYRYGLSYLRNATLAGVSSAANGMHHTFGVTRSQMALSLGTIFSSPTGGATIHPRCLIGCNLPKAILVEPNLATFTAMDASDGGIVANCIIGSATGTTQIFHLQSVTRGFALVQNVFEHIGNTSPNLQISADSAVTGIDNFLDFHNTVVGERYNSGYTDAASSGGVIKRITSRFNIWREFNLKTDTFTSVSTATGRVGNWRQRFGVGKQGNITLKAAADGTTAVSATSWNGDYLDSTNALNATTTTFTSDLSGSAGAGGGTYTLTGASNPAYNHVPSGLAGLGFDLAGVARLNDGTGAAGAYERTI